MMSTNGLKPSKTKCHKRNSNVEEKKHSVFNIANAAKALGNILISEEM